ncbi:MAG: SUMF1/EgtB/PvdO family nonheme iron enzyme [Anaerolineae bacterium]|nr:SUMF1/EgtB/PvdO family nonheme iron enzyme [Anaerolineae bacterium]
MKRDRHFRNLAAVCLIGLVALAGAAAGTYTLVDAQALTPTIPVKTQVWLDLAATAGAPTPDVAQTATYEAEFQFAVQTVTASGQLEVTQAETAVQTLPGATRTAPVTLTLAPTFPPLTATANALRSITPTEDVLRQTETFDTLIAQQTEMVQVTGGVFLMGTTTEEGQQAVDECALYGTSCVLDWIMDSTPVHQVVVDSFRMDVFEVNVAQYVAFLNWLGPDSHLTGCGGNPCAVTTGEDTASTIAFDGNTYSVVFPELYGSHPATGITWWGAQAYCEAVERRLPTEAEWERAARGPQGNIYPWGFEFEVFRANSSQSGIGGTEPVFGYPNGISPYGLYHMAGNVQEWVADWYTADYYTQQAAEIPSNPQGPANGVQKVLRGGGWDTGPLFLRSVHRRSAAPATTAPSIGFRCAADVSSTPESTAQPTVSDTPEPGS